MQNKNSVDLKALKRKYFIKRYIGFDFLPFFGEKKPSYKIIFSRIPKSFIKFFDQESYLYANPDVREAIRNKKIDNALEHFILYGYDEVKAGKRRIGNEFPFMTEEEYLSVNQDLKTAFNEGKLPSPFSHFIHFGYKEFHEKRRKLAGHYPFVITKEVELLLHEKFNDGSYLKANPDLVSQTVENAWEYFLSTGIDEIRRGERVFHKDMPFLSEYEYVMLNQDIFEALKNGIMSSPSEHFFLHGMWEIINGTRNIKGENTYRYYEPVMSTKTKDKVLNYKGQPLISVCMIVKEITVDELTLAIESLHKQWYKHWELHILLYSPVDAVTEKYFETISETGVKIHSCRSTGNVSSEFNKILSLVNGDYVSIMHSNDILTVDALYETVETIQREDADLIYSDEDKITREGRYINPHFKPDLSAEMIMSLHYFGSFLTFRKSLLLGVGGMDASLESRQEYDLILKVLEKTNKVMHIAKVLYHQRKVPSSEGRECVKKEGKEVLGKALARRGISATVSEGLSVNTYRVQYPIDNDPLVSIVIPFKDMPELLEMCVGSILEKSTYSHFEIIGISNNSEEDAIFTLMKELEHKDKRVHFYEYNEPFNYSAVNNYAVNNFVKGEHVILLNNDIEIISEDWIEAMLEFSQQKEIGAVGAKLYYPDDTIQHAGVIIGIGDSAAHAHRHFQKYSSGYHDRLNVIQNYAAVTAACLMVKTSIYHEMNGLNEEHLKVAFNDVDFCLRVMEKGYRNVFTPYAEAYHYESISRGYEDSSEKIKRFYNERGYLQERHAKLYETGDPYYNKNLTYESEDFSPGKYVSYGKERFLGKKFREKIIVSKSFNVTKHDYVCIFSHYDKDDIIDPYVIYYLSLLSAKYDIIIVSTAENLSNKELGKIAPYCMHAIVKENVGYDFAAWKTGLDYLGQDIEKYKWLTLCNDSVYGPFHPIGVVTEHLEDESCDIFSLSENYERKRHFQSYFVSYSKKVFTHDLFKDFWKNFKIYEDKTTLINTCEIDFSHSLISCTAFRSKTFAKRYDDTYVNVVQFYWDKAIKDGFPFMKIELFKDNPSKIDISNWKQIMREQTDYPEKLINNHLKRIKGK